MIDVDLTADDNLDLVSIRASHMYSLQAKAAHKISIIAHNCSEMK